MTLNGAPLGILPYYSEIEWYSDALGKDSSKQDVIANIASTARRDWSFPLMENGVFLNVTHAYGSVGYAEVTVHARSKEQLIQFLLRYIEYGHVPTDPAELEKLRNWIINDWIKTA